jgi:hypothetical protein
MRFCKSLSSMSGQQMVFLKILKWNSILELAVRRLCVIPWAFGLSHYTPTLHQLIIRSTPAS